MNFSLLTTEFLRPGTELQTGDFPVWGADNSHLLVEEEVRLSARFGELDFCMTPGDPQGLLPHPRRGNVCRSLGSCGIMLAAN